MGQVRRALLISNSTVHGKEYLEHCGKAIKSFLGTRVKTVLFVPYALHDQDGYADKAAEAFSDFGYKLDSVHRSDNPMHSVMEAEAIFIGGGNTFRLLKMLYDNRLILPIRKRVLEDGVPYIGSSAGTNVATCSIKTTNDMPIVFPPTFDAINIVPFNINAHYISPDPTSTHMGETRDTRIKQYHEYETSPPVLGMREGSWLIIEGDTATLQGTTGAKLFARNKESVEYGENSDLSFLLTTK